MKVYEAMKPAKAAEIFNATDTGLLLPVVKRMRETKVAAVVEEMDPAKAQALTLELARGKELPQVPPRPAVPSLVLVPAAAERELVRLADLLGPADPVAEVAQQAVVQAVDPAVHARAPGRAPRRPARSVVWQTFSDLLDHVELAQPVRARASGRGRGSSASRCSRATSWTWRSQLSISPSRRSSQRRRDAAAAVVAARR